MAANDALVLYADALRRQLMEQEQARLGRTLRQSTGVFYPFSAVQQCEHRPDTRSRFHCESFECYALRRMAPFLPHNACHDRVIRGCYHPDPCIRPIHSSSLVGPRLVGTQEVPGPGLPNSRDNRHRAAQSAHRPLPPEAWMLIALASLPAP